MSFSAKLDTVLDRFAVLEARMAGGAEGGDYVRLARDHAELEPIVARIRALKAAEAERLRQKQEAHARKQAEKMREAERRAAEAAAR